MKTRQCIIVALASGLLLSVGSCLSDFGYYALDAFGDYLPDLLDALETSTTTS